MRHAFAMGVLMGGAMLWMVHMRLVSGADVTLSAALAFVGAHLALGLAVAAIALFVPRARALLRRHRPGRDHVLGMLAGAGGVVVATHVVLHGGLV